jgi:hypothetical protein
VEGRAPAIVQTLCHFNPTLRYNTAAFPAGLNATIRAAGDWT